MSDPQVVLVTGASRRLGLCLVEKFLERNCQVVALSRKASSELRALAENSMVDIYEIDYYDAAQVQIFIDAARAKYSCINVLIHNASTFEMDGKQFDFDRYQSMFQVHMSLPAHLNTGLSSLLSSAKDGACVVHVTDIFADNPDASYALYCSTKAAAENLMKGFAKKLAPSVRVNSIQPGPIKFLPSHTEEAKERVLSETPLGIEGGFEPVVLAILGLVENPYMTGATIKVDGGRALGRR